MPAVQDTTSWAMGILESHSFTLFRQFIVGSADYSDRVLKWPNVERTWDEVRPREVSVTLANDDAALNFFRSQKTNLRSQCELSLTVVNTLSSIQFYSGSVALGHTRHFISIASNQAFNTSSNQALALEAVVYPDMSMSPGQDSLIMGIGVGSTGAPLHLLRHRVLASGSHYVGFVRAFSDGTATGNSVVIAPAPNSYTPLHVLCVMASTISNIYLDGVMVASYTSAPEALSEQTHAWIAAFSSFHTSDDNVVMGTDRISQARFWNRFITNSEAVELAVDSVSDESNLAGWYELNEGFGRTAYDISGNSNHGLLNSQENFRLPEWVYVAATDVIRGAPVQNKNRLQLGVVSGVEYDNGSVRINVSDKFKQLGERVIGTNDTPVDYTGSDYLPSDLAWYAVTSYGGLSNVESISNPDIDYASFLSWAAVFSGDSVIMRAYYDGQRITEVLRKLARMTDSAIHISDGKLTFHRFTIAEEAGGTFTPDTIIGLSLRIDDTTTVNKQIVEFDFNVTSHSFAKSVVAQDSTSVNSFGLREEITGDESIWYVNSVSALNFAERRIFVSGTPYDRVQVESPLFGFPLRIGNRVTINDAFFGMADSYRIMEASVDMDTLKVTLGADQSQFANAFKLDYSALDSSDVLV